MKESIFNNKILNNIYLNSLKVNCIFCLDSTVGNYILALPFFRIRYLISKLLKKARSCTETDTKIESSYSITVSWCL